MTTHASAPVCALAAFIASAALLAGCSGGASSDAAASTVPVPTTISGAITFDRVPVANVALDYTNTTPEPARGITVQAVTGDGTILGGAVTDDLGRYSLSFLQDAETLRIRALAEMRRSGNPSWDYRIVDNTREDALYALESDTIALDGTDLVVDLHAASGWDGSAYSEPRAAAPFAILDVVHDATQFVLTAAPDTQFPPLMLHWSPSNVPTAGADGMPDFITGEIGSSFYRPGFGIFLLGAAEIDTDEYDRHVIAHEWAHYLEHALARSDSIGGPHTRGDQLDMRTAFSEGFANAFSAMVLGDTRYVDVLGPGQASGFAFNVDGPFHGGFPNPHPGWFSEESVQEILFDLFDDGQDTQEDTVAFGFAPMLEVFMHDLREGRALTSIFSFVHALRNRAPEQRPAIDAVLAAHSIGPFEDEYGTGESNVGAPIDPERVASGDILPIYKPLSLDASVELCSTDAYTYEGFTGYHNKLGTRAFAAFEAPAIGTYVFEAVASVVPAGQAADPDMVLHGGGVLVRADSSPDESICTPATPEGCTERFERFLGPGAYVLEVYEWTNTQARNSPVPPIGRTCFDVTVSLR